MTSHHGVQISLRRAGPDDAAALSRIARRTFVDTFASENTPENMAMYVDSAFSEDVQRTELCDDSLATFFAEQGSTIVGYVTLHDHPAPVKVTFAPAIEILRLYVDRQCIGSGIGAALMQHSLEEAARRGKEIIWLGVWEHNPRAMAFYRRFGFVDTGSHAFVLGRDVQTDRLMSRRVEDVLL